MKTRSVLCHIRPAQNCPPPQPFVIPTPEQSEDKEESDVLLLIGTAPDPASHSAPSPRKYLGVPPI